MDRVEAMSILLTVVEAGSLSAAARRLNAPLATVSRKVSDLEFAPADEALQSVEPQAGAHRSGQLICRCVQADLADVMEAERAASGEYAAPTGELTVTAPVGLGRVYLVPILAEFLKAYPEIDVHLLLNDRVMNLSEEQIDVALRMGALPDSSLMALRLGAIRRVFCASPAYLAARGTPRTPDELAGHDCVSYPNLMSPDVWTFPSGKTNLAVRVHSRLVVSNAETACDAARASIGITAAFSYLIEEALEAGTLTTLLDDFEPPARPVSLVYVAGRFLPIKLGCSLILLPPA